MLTARAPEPEADAVQAPRAEDAPVQDDPDGLDGPAVQLGHVEPRLRLAYADPPYPGKADLYADHPDFAGEVDHRELIEQLGAFDGWALSTAARSLRELLPLCPPDVRVVAWCTHRIGWGWEPVIVSSARPVSGVRDWLRVEPDSYQWRPRPAGYVVGQKPEPFCRWVFRWLGARPDDELADLFPGSGSVGHAWASWSMQPELDPSVQLELVQDGDPAARVLVTARGRRRRRRPPRRKL